MWVEVYKHDVYAVKFHLKAHRNSPYKYSLMTGLNEPRPVVNTCIAIMLEIAKQNPDKIVLTMLNDTAERYISTDLFADLL